MVFPHGVLLVLASVVLVTWIWWWAGVGDFGVAIALWPAQFASTSCWGASRVQSLFSFARVVLSGLSRVGLRHYRVGAPALVCMRFCCCGLLRLFGVSCLVQDDWSERRVGVLL